MKIEDILDYEIKMRNSLNFDKNINFGFEIESDHVNVDELAKRVRNNPNLRGFDIKADPSLDDGAEIASPIASNNKELWECLKKVCKCLKTFEKISFNFASIHVHVNSSMLEDSNQYYKRLYKTYLVYEDLLYRFGYGIDSLFIRASMEEYAKHGAAIINNFLYDCSDNEMPYNHPSNLFMDRKKYGLSFRYNDSGLKTNVKTIEFRMFNSTTRCEEIQNDINLCISFLNAIKRNTMDNELIEYYYQEILKNGTRNIDYVKECKLDKAVKFVDQIYNNEDDKMSFLRQYVKPSDRTNMKF